jgi:branched-chain amino acid transport system ATP-binding protein
MIEVQSLTVRFGGVTPIDDMSVTMDVGVNGLIGPNGAGKTTFFNVLSGFVRPAHGHVTAFGISLLDMPDFRRVRWGLRRTFQTEQAIADMTVLENVLLVLEHSGTPRTQRLGAVVDAVEFVGLGDRIDDRVGLLGAAERRLVEVARAVVGSPRLVLLDEPAAGLPDEESAHLATIIKQIPERTGALTILVDHDMTLVTDTCDRVAVLDFGHVIATGPTAEVLGDRRVMAAYLGEDMLDDDGHDAPTDGAHAMAEPGTTGEEMTA